jgi:hypothetical protein
MTDSDPVGKDNPAAQGENRVLDYAGPGADQEPAKFSVRDMVIAMGMQLGAVVLSSCVLDEGQVFSATLYLSMAYWCGVVLILLRRKRRISRGDRTFIRYGLIPILIIGVPLFMHVWGLKGAL